MGVIDVLPGVQFSPWLSAITPIQSRSSPRLLGLGLSLSLPQRRIESLLWEIRFEECNRGFGGPLYPSKSIYVSEICVLTTGAVMEFEHCRDSKGRARKHKPDLTGRWWRYDRWIDVSRRDLVSVKPSKSAQSNRILLSIAFPFSVCSEV